MYASGCFSGLRMKRKRKPLDSGGSSKSTKTVVFSGRDRTANQSELSERDFLPLKILSSTATRRVS